MPLAYRGKLTTGQIPLPEAQLRVWHATLHDSLQSTLRAGVPFSLRTAVHLLGRREASGLEGTELLRL